MINELIEKIAPYKEKYNLKISKDKDFLVINGDHYYALETLKSIEEDEITIIIKAKGYSIYLFKRVDAMHTIIY
jgi:hypothetical protein